MNAEIEQIELSIADAQAIVDRGQRAEALSRNLDFKAVVLDGYFTKEAARLALLVSDPGLSPEIREHVQRDLLGLGAFKRYLSNVVRFGHIAQNEIEGHRETLEEIRLEGDN